MTRVEELKKRQKRLKKRGIGVLSNEIYHSRRAVFLRVYQENSGEPKIIRKAKALSAFLREKKIVLEKDDILAGYQQPYDYSEPPDEPTIYKPQSKRFSYGGMSVTVGGSVILEELEKGRRVGLFASWLGGHVVADFEGLLRKGFGAIRDEAERKLVEKGEMDRNFLSAVIIVCDGVEAYIRRYAQRARLLARRTSDATYRRELERITESCEWVAVNPPRSLFEALQLFWLAHEVWTAEQYSGSLSLGRFDQYMFPYYRKDLQEGRTTREEALELIEVLWIKFNGVKRGFQNIVLGGQKADGTDATNDLSYICLEATEELQLPQPALTVRFHSKTPDKLLDRACRVLRNGGGLPALFNDDVIIPAMKHVGIAKEDAWNYGLVGCVEPTVPGKEWSHTEALRINWAKVLELVLNNGVCMVSGERMNMETQDLSELNSFEELYSFFKKALGHFIDFGVKALNIIDKNFYDSCPYPYLSTIMAGCIEKGKDVTAGGAKYNLTTINGCGMANTADSLAAIKKLVYEDKVISLQELRETLRSNFSGEEALRQRLTNKAPKYGNDDDYVDIFMKDLSEFFCDRVMRHRNPRGGKFQAGLYTVDWHAILGKLTGALPDGRLASKSLANGLSPSQGRDRIGPTAVLRSITKLNHSLMANGMVLDMKFYPTALSGREDLEKFKSLIKTYFVMGGMEIQFNVVDRKTLIEAQKSPENYGDLVVRVSGFSAYFTRLDKEIQDEIIARTGYN